MKCAREVLIVFKPQPVRSMNRFHTSPRAKYEMRRREVLIVFKPQRVRSMNRFHTSPQAKYEMHSYFLDDPNMAVMYGVCLSFVVLCFHNFCVYNHLQNFVGINNCCNTR